MLLLSHLTASSRTWSWWPRSGATCAAHSPFEHGDAHAPEETPTRQGPHATAEQWGGSLGGVWVLRPHVKLLSREKRHGGKTFHSVECPGRRSWRVGSNSHGCTRRLCRLGDGRGCATPRVATRPAVPATGPVLSPPLPGTTYFPESQRRRRKGSSSLYPRVFISLPKTPLEPGSAGCAHQALRAGGGKAQGAVRGGRGRLLLRAGAPTRLTAALCMGRPPPRGRPLTRPDGLVLSS